MKEVGIVFLYVVGLALVIAEMFMPGAILGLIGLGCAVASIVLAFKHDAAMLGWIMVVTTILSIPVLIVLWVKVLNRVFAIKTTQKGYSSAMMELKDMVGQEGVALTQLRPSGMARFGDKKVDVVADGEVIEKHTRVKIVEVESNRVLVRAVQQ